MLSIFPRTSWPSAHILWRNVYLDILNILFYWFIYLFLYSALWVVSHCIFATHLGSDDILQGNGMKDMLKLHHLEMFQPEQTKGLSVPIRTCPGSIPNCKGMRTCCPPNFLEMENIEYEWLEVTLKVARWNHPLFQVKTELGIGGLRVWGSFSMLGSINLPPQLRQLGWGVGCLYSSWENCPVWGSAWWVVSDGQGFNPSSCATSSMAVDKSQTSICLTLLSEPWH